MIRFRTIFIVMAAVAGFSLAAALPADAAGKAKGCLSDQQIQSAIASGEIQSWPKIKKLAGISADFEEVSDVKVCLTNGVPFYTVNVVSPSGEATKIVLNAIDGTT